MSWDPQCTDGGIKTGRSLGMKGRKSNVADVGGEVRKTRRYAGF